MIGQLNQVGLVGFGEAGRAITSGWGSAAGPLRAFDIKTTLLGAGGEVAAAYAALGVEGADSLAGLLGGRGVILCLVTADQAAAVAAEAGVHLRADTLWLDGNSCSPGSKRRAAAAIEAAGGRYVDVAIMAPIQPRLHRTPMLLAGPHAEAAAAWMRSLDMTVDIVGDRVGAASAVKMLRSVMVKGIEALTAECLLAARQAGVDDLVLNSFEQSDPEVQWRRKSLYNLARMTEHGVRRAAEMREVAATLRELGLPDRMAAAAAEWQDQLGQLGVALNDADLASASDRLRALL
jgi:3-hydroxyisobutyrate dehydrogenase-like beta-hydroxyacid dehydrogenase